MNISLITKYSTATVLLIVLTLLIKSCVKDQPNCSGNCANISISGITFIKTNSVGLANVPVEAIWFRKAYCIGCTSYKVTSGKSGNDGKFNFNTTIDTTFFKDYNLTVRIPSDTNYIIVPINGVVYYNEQIFSDFNLIALQNIKF